MKCGGRDNAQKDIVLRGDRLVVPALKQIALGENGPLKEKPSELGRLHALWTLDGLEATDKEVLLKAMEDEDPQVRKAAIWISEPFIKKNDVQVIDKLEKLKGDESYDVQTQLVLSLNYAKTDKAKDIVKNILEKNSKNQMVAAVQNSIAKNEEIKKLENEVRQS
ncbi:MAG: HEAT repeat domain-containing protein [Segetibacter sp.]